LPPGPSIAVTTPLGALVIGLRPDVAPVSSATFLAYLRGGHLDGASFFRILTQANQARFPVRPETVQWGWRPPGSGAWPADPHQAQPLPPIALEPTSLTGLRHRRGSMSMARRGGVVMGTEYFICLGDEPELDAGGSRNPDGLGFAVFAQVIEGDAVLDAIHARGEAAEYIASPIPVLSIRECRGVIATGCDPAKR
jgi:peptidyl-prolyl cis-trans isomerase A (cyclophilin A)